MPPQQLVGYHVVRVLGSGDRAEVLLAHDGNQIPVALKVFRPGIASDDVDRELAALADHSGTHLIALSDVATAPDGRCVAVLPRLTGPLLSTLMRERGATWQLGELLTVLVPIVAAVAAAHHAGFAHGAITARAIMFTDAGAPVLIGLGHTIRCSFATGEAGIGARAARRSDYERLGELLTQLSAQLAPGEEFEIEAFEDWFHEQLNRTPFEPFGAELERALFELAVPIPVQTDAASVQPPAGPARVPVQTAMPTRTAGPAWAFAHALAFLPEELSAVFRGLPATAGERLRAIHARLPSRKPLLVAAGIVTLLLAAALLWPAADKAAGLAEISVAPQAAVPSTSTVQDAAPHVSETGSGSGVDHAIAVATGSDDPAVAFPALIEMRADCLVRLDTDCLAAALQVGSGLLAADTAQITSALASGGEVAPIPAVASNSTVSERSGDAAIMIYVPTTTGGVENEPASALMIRTEAGWRLRELFEP